MEIKLYKSIIKYSLYGIFIFSLNINNISYADTIKQPSIKIDSSFWNRTGIPGISSGDDGLEKIEKGIPFKFEIFLGKSKDEINNVKRETYSLDGFKKKEINYKNKYKILVYPRYYGVKIYGRYLDKGIYIFNNQNICIGYLFVTKEYTTEQIYNEPEIINIKSMIQNSSYLLNKLKMPRNQITFYEKENGDYIERYGLNNDYLYMQGFYPKELEKFMSKRIISVLNFNYESANKPPVNTTDDEFKEHSEKMEANDENDSDD